MSTRSRKWSVRIFRVCIGLSFAFCVAGTFGVSTDDETTFRSFAEASEKWQKNTEFRSAALEYCSKGSGATRARVLGVPAAKIVMQIRSIPHLPKRFAAEEGSQEHYDDFSHGPLEGYLHLCRKQDVNVTEWAFYQFRTKNFAQPLRGNEEPSLAKMDVFMQERSMGDDHVVTNDPGSRQSAAALFNDTELLSDPTNPDLFIKVEPSHNFAEQFEEPIRVIATELQLKTSDPKKMTPEEQQWVLDRLDSYVRVHNRRLWRTKQLSDFFNGVWAQAYGPDYGRMLIVPIMATHTLCRNLLFLLLTALVVNAIIRSRRKLALARKSPEVLEPAEMAA